VAAAKWSGLAVALLATAALSGYLSMRQAVRSEEVVVPPLEGTIVADATALLRSRDLILETIGERSDDRVPVGQILIQDPPAGARLKPNRRVKVIVSLGTEVLLIPSLTGQPARRAQIALQQAGLKLGEVAYATSAKLEGDRVLAQDPAAGVRGSRDASVNILVSKGPRTRVWVMPRLEGEEIGRVTRMFADGGFRIGSVRPESSPGTPPGRILRQAPAAGYPLREGDSISLVVSAEVPEGD
jgi:serine/threonine-protein kinase